MSDDLRERIAAALWRLVMSSDAPDNDEDRAATLATADAVLAVVQPELDANAAVVAALVDTSREQQAEIERWKMRYAEARAAVARLSDAVNAEVTPSLGMAALTTADDVDDKSKNYALVNPRWLLALITEAQAVRAALRIPDGGSDD